MTKILIAEDDEIIFAELKNLLVKNGYAVLDGREQSKLNENFDLALLDVKLPGASGYELCAKIRETSGAPVIFLTSLDKPENELMGFAVGGDDFVRKPFNPAVLLARISRLLKKTEADVIVRGKLTLDRTRLEARNGDAAVSLSKTEFTLLKILADREGVIAQKDIIEKLWDNEAYIDENTLYVNVNRLREKLKSIGLHEAIRTVRGAGYRLE